MKANRVSFGVVLLGIFGLAIQLSVPSIQVNSAPQSLPVDLQPTIFVTQLEGGFDFRASPKLAEVRTDVPGLEIVVGSAATKATQGSRPASVALLTSNGSILWEKTTFTWNSTQYNIGTIKGTSAVADLDNNGQMDIVVGMGGTSDPVTQGGILALKNDGSVLWYVATKSIYDGNSIPDGVYTSPSVADFDGDGRQEVVVGGFDQYLWLIDGPTGSIESGFPISMWDTINSSTAVADLDRDGYPDFTFGGDFTNNGAGSYRTDDVPQLPPDGGVMRAMKYRNGEFYLPGWDECISTVWACVPDVNNNNLLIPIGQWMEQVIFSSPAIGDIDNNGQLEIVAGSGYYWSPATVGHWVKIWRADGTLLKTLNTNGVTFASPALGDLNDDGYLDIVIGDMQMGNNSQGIYSGAITGPSTLYAWSGKPADNFAQLWSTTIGTWQGPATQIGMFSSPVIADIAPDQAGPEILFGFNTEIVVFNGRTGTQLTYVGGGPAKPTLATYGFFENSPAVADIDNDGRLEIVATNDYAVPIGSPRTWRQHVFAWRWPGAGNNAAGAYLPWPTFRRDGPNHAYFANPTLNVSPLQFNFLYQSGSGTANPGSSFIIQNLYNTANMDYTITYPASYITLGKPAKGTIGPGASLVVPFTVKASTQADGRYPFTVTVEGSSGSALINSPQQIQFNLFVGDVSSDYLPIIRKN